MDCYYAADFPADAIADCSGPGPADDAVAYWVGHLNFSPDPKATRICLRGYGAWDAEELDDDEKNVQRLFWIMMGAFSEGDDIFAVE